jgi:hypothetical protein
VEELAFQIGEFKQKKGETKMANFGKFAAFEYVLKDIEKVNVWAVGDGMYYKGIVETPKGFFKFDTGGSFDGEVYPNITKKRARSMLSNWKTAKKITPKDLFKNWENFKLYKGRDAEINWAQNWGHYAID